jgi:hypothetical protein
MKNTYEYVSKLNDNRAVFRTKNGRMGAIDSVGKVVIQPNFKYISDFSEDRAEIYIIKSKKTLRGFIDENGEVVIQPAYENTMPFKKGVSIVQNNFKFNLIDKKGKLLFPDYLDYIFYADENILGIRKDGKSGYIDMEGKNITPMLYKEISRFSEGKAVVENFKEEVGVIDIKGKIVLEFQKFNNIYNFKNNCAVFTIDDECGNLKAGVINGLGKIVIPTIYDLIFQDNDGFYHIRENKLDGLIDKNFNVIIKPEYESIYIVNDTVFIVQKDKKQGLVNNKGEIVLPIEFKIHNKNKQKLLATKDSISGFIDLNKIIFNRTDTFFKVIDNKGHLVSDKRESFIVINESGKYGVIDYMGNIIIPVKYEEVFGTLFSIYAVKQNGKYGIMNIENKILKPFIYDKVSLIKAGFILYLNDKKEKFFDESML